LLALSAVLKLVTFPPSSQRFIPKPIAPPPFFHVEGAARKMEVEGINVLYKYRQDEIFSSVSM